MLLLLLLLFRVPQVPSWLDTSHPRVTIVPHRSIFRNVSHLPTFNSNAIQANLASIPGGARWGWRVVGRRWGGVQLGWGWVGWGGVATSRSRRVEKGLEEWAV
jgi:hypothetical protein